jgi:hypothetical protein
MLLIAAKAAPAIDSSYREAEASAKNQGMEPSDAACL